MSKISFRLAKPEDIPECHVIQSASYPPDEAAKKSWLEYRQSHARSYFLCALNNESEIIGFVCSTRCSNFDYDAMSTHDPKGSLLAIHSVVVKEEYRRKGIASRMMKNYIKIVSEDNQVHPSTSISKIVLIAKSHLLGFYENLGFSVLKVSDIVYGQEQWYDLQMNLVRDLPLSNDDC